VPVLSFISARAVWDTHVLLEEDRTSKAKTHSLEIKQFNGFGGLRAIIGSGALCKIYFSVTNWLLKPPPPLVSDECELPKRRITKGRIAKAYSEYLLGLQRSI
jgi:hypothetical protein